jgi:hypothetical protein
MTPRPWILSVGWLSVCSLISSEFSSWGLNIFGVVVMVLLTFFLDEIS